MVSTYMHTLFVSVCLDVCAFSTRVEHRKRCRPAAQGPHVFACCEARVEGVSDGLSRFHVAGKLGSQNNQHVFAQPFT